MQTARWAVSADFGPSPGSLTPGILPVKCRLEDGAFSETRLLLLRRQELEELRTKLGWLFNLRGHYRLRYLDKFGDMITFSSEEEFQLALVNHLQPEFRVLITPAEASRAKSSQLLNGGEPKTAQRKITFVTGEAEGAADTGAGDKSAAQTNGYAKSSVDFPAAVNGINDGSTITVKTASVSGDAVSTSVTPALDPGVTKKVALRSDAVSKSTTPTIDSIISKKATLPNDAVSRKAALPSDAASKSSALLTKSVPLTIFAKSEKSVNGIAAHRSAVKTASNRPTTADGDDSEQSTQPQGLKSHSDWAAAFHPDYLRPRTATSRKGGDRRRATLDIQASLAGYPKRVASPMDTPPPRRREAPPLSILPTTNGGEFVHFGIECSRCGADPLTGWRYKCSQCPNYNLCDICFHCYSHDGHGFYRLP